MRTKLVLMLAAMFGAIGAFALDVGLGTSQSILFNDFTAESNAYPFTASISVTNGIEVGSFDVVFDADPTGATVGFAGSRLGIISPPPLPGTNQTINQTEVMYITFTNISANITNFQFNILNTYLLNSAVNNTNLLEDESITLYDGDGNSQLILGGANQQGNAISNLLSSVSLDGETFYIETSTNSDWYINSLRFDVGLPPSELPSNSVPVVNYDWNGGTAGARAFDTETTNSRTWYFSDEIPLWDLSNGTNMTIYGGTHFTWPATNINSGAFTKILSLRSQSGGRIQIQINPPGDIGLPLKRAQGIFVWKKEDFINDGASNTVSLANGALLRSNVSTGGFASDFSQMRFVVQQDGTYYVSSASSDSSGLFVTDSRATDWAPISLSTNSNDYTIGAYGSPVLDDVTAFGYYFDIARGTNNANQVLWSINEFTITAELTDGGPVVLPVVGPLSIDPLNTDVVISWQAGAVGTHTLQTRPALTFGTWSNVTAIVPGVETTLSVTTTATEAESFYRVSAE